MKIFNREKNVGCLDPVRLLPCAKAHCFLGRNWQRKIRQAVYKQCPVVGRWDEDGLTTRIRSCSTRYNFQSHAESPWKGIESDAG